MSLQAKLDQRMKLVTAAREILDAADTENRGLTAEDAAKYDAIDADIDAVNAEIEALQAIDTRNAKLSDLEARLSEDRGGVSRETILNGGRSTTYRSAFKSYLKNGRNGLEAHEVRALQVGTNSEGGFLVAQEFDNVLRETMDEFNVLRRLGTVIQTSGDHNIPFENTLGTAAYVAEEANYSGAESDPAFGRVTLSAFKLGTMVKISEELLQDDIIDIEAYIARNFGRRFANREETAFAVGTGSGQPTGLTTQASAGITAAGQTAITADELINLQHSLKSPYRPNATWVVADSTLSAIRKLKDGDSQYLWQPGLQAGIPDRLLGNPIVTSSGMPALAESAVTVLYGDFSYFVIADRGPTVVQRLNELFAATGQVGFRGYMRHDAKLTLAESIKKLTQLAA